ncbi:MAG: type II toxin-antitoxin system VapC family toxin [Thermoplasmata archaeon]
MRVFVDSGIWIGALLKRDKYHKTSSQILSDVFQRCEFISISDWILDEVVSFLTRKDWKLVKRVVQVIQQSGKVEMLTVDSGLFASAKVCLEEYPDLRLTLTDWTSLLLMKREGIREIASLAREFERVRSIAEFAFVTPIFLPPRS